MSFIFESDVELDDALVEAMEADEGEVDFGELEESYSELVTTLGSLNESMLMSVASAQYLLKSLTVQDIFHPIGRLLYGSFLRLPSESSRRSDQDLLGLITY